jgi:type I restriction enzyme R subunit
MGQVEELLDRSIAATKDYLIRGGQPSLDLSKIDFELLKANSSRDASIRKWSGSRLPVARHLQKMVRLNRTRIDFLERFQRMIDEYNSGSINVEEFFRRLMEFAKSLTKRSSGLWPKELSEEELALFSIFLLISPRLSLPGRSGSRSRRRPASCWRLLKAREAGPRLAQAAAGPGPGAGNH